MSVLSNISATVCICLLFCMAAQAQPRISLMPVAQGFSQPIEATHAGDGRIFVAERRGLIKIIDESGQVLSAPYLDIRSLVDDSESERGLLGLAFSPDFTNSGRFYLSYTNLSGDLVVARYLTDSTGLPDPGSAEILLTLNQPFVNHNGGCIRFGPDQMLYIAVGDGGAGGDPGDRSQQLGNPLGAIHRIDVSIPAGYALPSDNPFTGQSGAVQTIWAYGLRNPWKISFDPDNGDLWIADVGQDAREEVNKMPADSAGVNYGWRCREGIAGFNTSNCPGGYTDPIWDYPHGNATGASVTGGFVYRGSAFPELFGHYIFGDYVSGNIWTLFPTGNGEYDTTVQGQLVPNGQLTSFGLNQHGEIFVLTKSGTVYQVLSSPTSIPNQNLREVSVSYHRSGEIIIKLPTNTALKTVEIRDITGRLTRSIESPESIVRLPPGLPAGIYLIKINADTPFLGKIVVR